MAARTVAAVDRRKVALSSDRPTGLEMQREMQAAQIVRSFPSLA
jgi:hypothetical protein